VAGRPMKPDVGNLRWKETILATLLRHLIHGNAYKAFNFRPHILYDQVGKASLHVFERPMLVEDEVRIEVIIEPELILQPHDRRTRNQHIEFKVRVAGRVLSDAGNLVCNSIADDHQLAQRLFLTEIFCNHIPGEDNGLGLFQRRTRISGKQLERKEVEEVRVCVINTVFIESLVAIFDNRPPELSDTGSRFDVGDFISHSPPQWRTGIGGANFLSPNLAMEADVVHPVSVDMESIVAQLIDHIQHDQYACGYADRHAEHVDGRVEFVLQDVPDRNLEIVSQHILIML